jgi:hypothetical protein
MMGNLTLYKFISPERIHVLQNLKVRFTQPCQLNDPFESNALVDARHSIDMDTKLHELASKFNARTDEERAFVEKWKAEMRLYAANAISPQSIGRGLTDFLNLSQGVLSLSRANDNLLMWAHYGSSHRGYALGLDEAHEWFHGVDELGRAIHPRNVIYSSRRAVAKTQTDEFFERLLCYKSVDWAYEEEVRIFRPFGDTQAESDSNKPDQVHLFRIPRECLKEIFIGANATAFLKNQIFQAVKKNKLQVEIYQAYVNDERYELGFRLVEQIPDYKPR